MPSKSLFEMRVYPRSSSSRPVVINFTLANFGKMKLTVVKKVVRHGNCCLIIIYIIILSLFIYLLLTTLSEKSSSGTDR